MFYLMRQTGNVFSEGKAEYGPPLDQTLKEDMAPPEASVMAAAVTSKKSPQDRSI